jgi:thioredoxin 1
VRHVSSLAIFAAGLQAIVATAPAAATPAVQPFNQAAFDAAQKAGKPILVWVHAPWCPVCREQAKTITRLTAEPAYRDMQVFRIDYDTQKPLWQKFGAPMQSTVIAFHGKRETARIAHETDDGKVSAVIHSAIA